MSDPLRQTRERFADALAAAGPSWLPRQRWFGDKTRTISSVSLADAATASIGGRAVALAFARVAFADGDEAEYSIPLAMTDDAVPDLHRLAEGEPAVVDALAVPAVRAWLLERLGEGARFPADSGEVVARPGAGLAQALPGALAGPSRLSTAEQSNSTIVYGDALLLKVFRKLQPGLNPDIEIGRFLTERTSFRNLPVLLGDVTYLPEGVDRAPVSLAMAQPFVRGLGDGWSVMLDRLRALLDGDDPGPAVELARQLGTRTAQLHLALASDASDPAFAPEPIEAEDVRRWSENLAGALARTIADLRDRAADLPVPLREQVLRLSPDDPTLAARRGGFAALVGVAKIRVHGDYHLGQTLVALDGDVVLLDFEGEPARSLEERRRKTSPLKDVAGMLRSFGYARAAAARAYHGPLIASEGEARLSRWEADAREGFLAAYLAEARPVGAIFLPPDDDAFAAAVDAWELDKAVYEVNYELNNRPDWLDLPLGTLQTSHVFPR